VGTGFFPGVKRPGRGVDHPPHLAPRLKKEYRYTSTPLLGLRGLLWGELYLHLCVYVNTNVNMQFYMFLIRALKNVYTL